MAKRIQPQEIVEMHRLLYIYGTFAEVGRRYGRSASSVASILNCKVRRLLCGHTFKEVVRVLGEK